MDDHALLRAFVQDHSEKAFAELVARHVNLVYATALRLVVLADRLYDREVPVLASGLPFDRLFSEEMLNGGYRKKYFRAISRLTALARDAKRLVEH